MLVQVKTDNHIEGTEKLQKWVTDDVTAALSRFTPQLTRVEVYLSDLNSHKTVDGDKQCKVEACLAGLDPIVVTKNANEIDVALSAALDAMILTLDSRLEKLQQKKGRTPMGGEPGI
jgi:ribosome-associated translation inhibitor RaiA